MVIVNSMVEDTGLIKSKINVPSVDELNTNNLKTNVASSFNMPSLEVYKPDYGALQSSFDEILKSFDMYKQSAQSSFEAGKAGLDLNLEQSVRNIGEAKVDNKQAFTKGRQQVSEDIYSANRQTQSQMSARGLGGSGVEALANLQTRMSAGETVSDMAGEFFDAQEKLVQAETDTREQYGVTLQNLNSSLQGAMAQIMSQEASSKMGYTQMVENLKRQVVSDTNTAKQAQAEWQNARSQMEEAGKITETMVQQVLEYKDVSDDFKVKALMDFGYPEAQAKTMVAQQKVTDKANTSTANREQIQQAQLIIDNLLNLGKTAEADSYLTQLAMSGIDTSKINVNGSSSTKGKDAGKHTDAETLGKTAFDVLSGNTIGNSPYIGLYDFFTKKK